VGDLQVLGVARGRAQRHRDVVGDLVAAIGITAVCLIAPSVNTAMSVGAAADVDQAHAQVALVVEQHRVGGSERAAA
jgi:hypothetical protein